MPAPSPGLGQRLKVQMGGSGSGGRQGAPRAQAPGKTESGLGEEGQGLRGELPAWGRSPPLSPGVPHL